MASVNTAEVDVEIRRHRGFDLPGVPGGFHQGCIQMFMLLTMRIGLRRQDARGPLAIGTIVDILAFERIFSTIKINLILTDGSAGHGHQILRDPNRESG